MMLYKNNTHVFQQTGNFIGLDMRNSARRGRAHLGRYRRITFPARVLTSCWVAKRTKVVSHLQDCSLRSLSWLLSVLLPSMNTDGGMISTVDWIRLTSCFLVVKCTRLFHFSNFQLSQRHLGCTGTPGLCRDVHRTTLMLKENKGMYFPQASTPSQWDRIASELLKLN